MLRASVAVAAMLAGLTLSACGELSDAASGTEQTTAAPQCSTQDAILPPDTTGRLTLQPATARPGQTFTVTYPERKSRTTNLWLSGGGLARCRSDYVLFGGKDWELLPHHGTFAVDGDLQGRKSVTAVVPKTVRAGVYSVCGQEEHSCALLTVTG